MIDSAIRGACALAFVVAALSQAFGVEQARASEPVYDELPDGPAAEVARLYFSALALPGVESLDRNERAALLDAATLRYRDRLIDRAPSPSADLVMRHLARLAESDFARNDPSVVRQTCARHGLTEAQCEPFAGYARRVLVLEEMLVQGQLTLDALEVELVGAPRPKLAGLDSK